MTIASISGVALVPGVSRNRRLYTPELIAKTAKRMQERLADPNGLPIVMRTHHEAGDDSAKIVGRITDVSVGEDKSLRYKAQLYDTFHAKEIANLVTPEAPALRSVSIHGYWLGDTRQVQTENGPAMTADDLEIDAIDFTASPGVDGALIDPPGGQKATESGGTSRTPISESMEASVSIVGEGSLAVLSAGEHVVNADVLEAKYSADDMKALLAKGHAMKNASGEPSYPIADISDLKKAIKAVGRGKSGHDAIRKHIIKRAKALGQSALIPDNWNSDGSMKESAPITMSEVQEYYMDGPDGGAGFCIDAYAGPLSVTVRGCVSPDELRFVAQRAAKAALDTILTMDPDEDGDLADQDDFDAQGNFIGDQMGDEEETAKPSAPVLTEADLNARMEEFARRYGLTAPVTEAQATAGAGTVSKDDDMESTSGMHSHTHSSGESTTHTHGHLHTHESAGGGSYDHTHGHTHFHLPGADENHSHGHDHDHATAPGDTHESLTEEESAVSETTQAAEAAPNRTLTPEDLKALGETIGSALAEAIRAVGETKEPKHAAPTQETTESATETVAESIPNVTDEVAALKESLAKARKEIRDELRAEFLKENGLPARRGYRLAESDEEVEMTDGELFDNHRVDILLGAFAKPPTAPNAA